MTSPSDIERAVSAAKRIDDGDPARDQLLARALLALHEENAKLREALMIADDNMGWHGSGPNDREEFYCELCSAHALDSEDIPHSQTCVFLKVRSAAALARTEER